MKMESKVLPTQWLKVNKTFSEGDNYDLEDDGKQVFYSMAFRFAVKQKIWLITMYFV